MVTKRKAPSDADADRAYSRVLAEAERFGLIVQAYGGVATIAIPAEQRKAGVRGSVLEAACMVEP